MATKKPAQRKVAEKPVPIAKVLKDKKLPVKKPNKKVAQKKKPAAPKITPKMFEKHFYGLSQDEFKALCEVYVEQQLKIKITKQPDYDHWLNYFKGFPASHIRILVPIGQ